MPTDPYSIDAESPDWAKLKAACLRDEVNPDWFDNDEETVGTSKIKQAQYEAAAKAVCATCPTTCFNACLEFTLSIRVGQDYGIRAGMTRAERLVLRREAS